MATKKKSSNRPTYKVTEANVSSKKPQDMSLFDKLQSDLQSNNSYLNLILGALIVVVLGVLIFNYFNRPDTDLGPAQQAETDKTETVADVAKENLPGKYTIKEGDTLFYVAQAYYGDGYKYPELVKANNLDNENQIKTGQVIEIPKLAGADSLAQAQPSISPMASSSPTTAPPSASPVVKASPTPAVAGTQQVAQTDKGVGGAENQTIWGERITTDTYVVQKGDWLSTIAGRTYGDIYAYEKIAKANNISNPDLIEPGTVLKLPR